MKMINVKINRTRKEPDWIGNLCELVRENVCGGASEKKMSSRNELMWQLIFRDIYLCISLSPKTLPTRANFAER